MIARRVISAMLVGKISRSRTSSTLANRGRIRLVSPRTSQQGCVHTRFDANRNPVRAGSVSVVRSEGGDTTVGYLLIGLLLLAIVLGGATWLAVSAVGFLLTLLVAGLVGWAADAIVPGRLPGGWLGAILAGIIGGFLGTLVLGHIGPTIAGVNLIPAFIGAAAIAVAAELTVGSPRRLGRY